MADTPPPSPSTNGAAPVAKQRLTPRLLNHLITNFTSARQDWLRRASGMDYRRDLNDECGWPVSPSVRQFQDLYDREPVAAKVISFWPNETWQVSPLVYEDEDSETPTPFEAAWDALGKELAGEDGLFKSEEGSAIWEYLRRVDVLSGIGHYGILLLGLDDGLPLDQPVAGFAEENSYPAAKDKNGKVYGKMYEPRTSVGATNRAAPRTYRLTVNAKQTAGRKLLFLRAFPEFLAEVLTWETNPTSPRFGQPTLYRVNFTSLSMGWSGFGAPIGTMDVHWTRCIHVADTWHQAGGDEVMAIPRLEPVLNPVLDIRKVRGSSAEMYFKGAFPGYSLEPAAGLQGGDFEIDYEAAKDTIENLFNGLQRFALWENLQMKSLAPQVVDPTPQIEVQEKAICEKMDVAWRIWQGSERGQLASDQDQKRHNKNIAGRGNRYATPGIVQRFVGRCIRVGVLPRPVQVCCEWPEIAVMTAQEKAQIALTQTQTDAAYVAGNVGSLLSPHDYLTRVRGFTEEEADAILEAVKTHVEEVLQQDIAETQTKIEAGVMPDPVAGQPFGGAGGGGVTNQGDVPSAPGHDPAPVEEKPVMPPVVIHNHPPAVHITTPDVHTTVHVPEGAVVVNLPEPVTPPAPPLSIRDQPHREVTDVERDDDGEFRRVVKDYLPLPEPSEPPEPSDEETTP